MTNNHSTAKTLIRNLQRLGVSKYAMAKALGTTWNSVHRWSKGYGNPNPANYAALVNLLKDRKSRS